MRRRFPILATAAVLVPIGLVAPPSTAAARPSAVPASTVSTTANLIVNPGADAGAASPDGYQTVPIPGWAVTSGAPVVVAYGTPDFPNSSTPGSPNRGGNFFAGGNNGNAGLSQTEDVSAQSASIDAGSASYSLSGWLGGYYSQNDRAAVLITFRSTSGASLGSAQIGPVTASDRGNTLEFLQRNTSGTVPAGTRSIKVDVQFTVAYGYDDGYADDLALTLTTGSTPGSANLIVDGDAEASTCTTNGYDGTTSPGWTIVKGEPNDICYANTRGFPTASTSGPSNRGNAFFAGGATGNGQLSQTADVSAAASSIDAGTVTYNLSGWLGGYSSQSDNAALRATFKSSTGSSLGSVQIGPVTPSDRGSATKFLQRSASGTLPAGTRSVTFDQLYTYSAGDTTDGYADNLSFTISASVPAPPLTAPPVNTPSYDHVFYVMMENQDFEDIIGNSSAPYLNSLAQNNTLLTQSYAVVHPSDPNYVAMAAGSLYGLTDNSILSTTIDAPHIGTRVDAAHKTWKAYVENQNGNCDTTSHGSYYPDDVPFYYFKDLKTNSSYCQAHWQPLTTMVNDLKSAPTTPNFVWFAADGCDDMEGCGIAAGDTWLKNTLPSIFNSPAWTQQRSLLVVTFDEGEVKAYGPNYPNRIPTIVIGSQGTVKTGYQSSARVDHYGVLRMVHKALGLNTLTNNDAYAATVNDIWK